MKITAAVVREKGKPFQFEELDLQDPREGEVDVYKRQMFIWMKCKILPKYIL